MDCASCARIIEQSLQALDDVDTVAVNFQAETLSVEGSLGETAIAAHLAALGYTLAAPDTAQADAAATAAPVALRFDQFLWQHQPARIALLALIPGLAGFWLLAGAATAPMQSPGSWLVLGAILTMGAPIARKGLRTLIHARRMTIDLLMSIATLGAIGIGAWGEALTVIALFTLGESLEAFSAQRSRASIRSLLTLQPEVATVLERHPDGAEHEHHVIRAVASLAPGDRVLVRPGERIPVDARILEGRSEINEAAVTGESMPVRRGPDEAVHAATINGQGTLVVEVAAEPDDFLIARIARIVAEAQASRSPAERFIDRFARWYTPAVVVLAAAVALLPPVLFGQPLLDPATGERGWLYRGLTLLIVACPCALILSIPVTVVSALARLAHLGVLVKSGAVLAELGRVRNFAFDKTGTLTRGEPVLAGLRARECAHPADSLEACDPCDELVAMAAAVETASTHPLAHAVLHAASERRIAGRYARAREVIVHADGRGLSGHVAGRRVTVGHADLFADSAGIHEVLAFADTAGGSVMVVGTDEDAFGLIEVADTPRPESAAALAALKRIDPGFRVIMLTGDRAESAARTARSIDGIDEVRSGLRPEDKLAAVRDIEAARGPTAMVGDGINDTPALAGARLGVAMGQGGSHQAMEAADVVLMRDDLHGLADAAAIARHTRTRITENIVLSLGLKLLVLALAVPGIATLWLAVFADVGTTLLVTLNGMRLLRDRGAPPAA